MSAIICATPGFKPGDPAPEGYLAWHAWAAVQHKAGLRQVRCSFCSHYVYPQEREDAGYSMPIDGKTGKRVRVPKYRCRKCAAPPEEAPQ